MSGTVGVVPWLVAALRPLGFGMVLGSGGGGWVGHSRSEQE